ncbi:hypothetical protein A4A49_18669 [Nicotiana attenuata]|uniref:Uncharacterized protein n=1 Tax=Nicotiana attenuata TaxID=49451 RepID=A0A314KS56_NICAT|nr:hypothetical protein A4A49_18669 [Nicotiana attenuata]
MAGKYSLIKFAFLFTAILMTAITVNLSSFQKMQAMAMLDLPLNMLSVKQKLLSSIDGMKTCGRVCSSDKDCSDAWVCFYCKYHKETVLAPAWSGCD